MEHKGMNEQIKELALRAAYGVIDPNGPFTAEEFINFQEKFAELIVQECCDIFVELRTRPVDLAVKDVKKQFGVKE